MPQADRSSSSDDPISSSGKYVSPSRSAAQINGGGTVRAEIVDALVAADAERLNEVATRAQGLKTLSDVLAFVPEFGEQAQDMFRMIGREADAIYALAIQPSDCWTVQ